MIYKLLEQKYVIIWLRFYGIGVQPTECQYICKIVDLADSAEIFQKHDNEASGTTLKQEL